MKASLSSTSLACSALLFSAIFFLYERGFVPLFELPVLLLGLSQYEVPDEPSLH